MYTHTHTLQAKENVVNQRDGERNQHPKNDPAKHITRPIRGAAHTRTQKGIYNGDTRYRTLQKMFELF